jgi:hypothetical protein
MRRGSGRNRTSHTPCVLPSSILGRSGPNGGSPYQSLFEQIRSSVGAMVGSNETLLSLFPTADELLEVRPKELVPLLLRLAAGRGAMF